MSWEELQRINKAIENARWGLDKFGTKSPQGLAAKAEIKSLQAQKANLPPEILRRERVENLTQKLTHAVFEDMLGRSGGREIPTYIGRLEYEGVSEADIDNIITDANIKYQAEAQTITLKELQQKLEASLIDHYEATHKPLQVDIQAIVNDASDVDPGIQAYIKRAVNLQIDVTTIQSRIDDVLFLTETETKQKLGELTSAVHKYVADAAFMAELDPSYHVPKDMVIEIQIWEANEDEIQPSEAQRKIMRTKRDLEIRSVSKDIIQQAIYAGQKNT